MDSLKEKDNPAPNPAKRPRIEVDEELMRQMITLPDFERTFFAPVDCRNRSAIYVSTRTKHKVSEILHLLGNESTRLTALVDNMLRFVMDIYSGELNYLHEKKNNRRPF